MRLVWKTVGDDGESVLLDVPAVLPSQHEMRARDTAELQRETRFKLADIAAMAELEFPAMQLTVFYTLRAHGRMISFARAGELLDEVELVPEPGDLPDAGDESGVDPTSVPEGSAPADDLDEVAVSPM